MTLYKSLSKASERRENVEFLKITIKGESFPDELLDFPNLRELYLDGNCRDFPPETPLWKNLKVLSIKWPKFSGDVSSLFRLSCLENLKIIETPLERLYLPLGKTPAPLKSLTIKDCALEGLPEEISMIWNLQELNLSGNRLYRLPISFIDLQELRRLNLDNNHFSVFPDEVKKMPRLHHLSIDGNKFSEEEKVRIQREFHLWPG